MGKSYLQLLKKNYLLWSPPAPLRVNNHMSYLHWIQGFPDNRGRFATKDLVDFVSSFPAIRKKNSPCLDLNQRGGRGGEIGSSSVRVSLAIMAFREQTRATSWSFKHKIMVWPVKRKQVKSQCLKYFCNWLSQKNHEECYNFWHCLLPKPRP